MKFLAHAENRTAEETFAFLTAPVVTYAACLLFPLLVLVTSWIYVIIFRPLSISINLVCSQFYSLPESVMGVGSMTASISTGPCYDKIIWSICHLIYTDSAI